jgi:hypothetical protein
LTFLNVMFNGVVPLLLVISTAVAAPLAPVSIVPPVSVAALLTVMVPLFSVASNPF